MDNELAMLLCEFFLDEFREDAAGVGDWLAQGGQDPDEVITSVQDTLDRLRAQR